MPNSKHLLDELQEIGVEPDKVRIPGQLYDDLARLKLFVHYLDTPLYPLAEHILELGMSEIKVIIQDRALIEVLQRHLLKGHLLVGQFDPEDRHVSERAERISDTLKILKLVRDKAGSVEAIE